MADLEEKISSLLSSPEAVEQLMSVVKSLTGGSDGQVQPDNSPPSAESGEIKPMDIPAMGNILSKLAGGSENPSSEDAPVPDLSAISSVLGGLLGSNESSGNQSNDHGPPSHDDEGHSENSGNILSALGKLGGLGGSGGHGGIGGLGGLDPKTMGLIMKLLSAYSSGDEHKARLLSSLRPYIRHEKQDRIDRAIQIVKLARVAKVALSSFGGGDGNV